MIQESRSGRVTRYLAVLICTGAVVAAASASEDRSFHAGAMATYLEPSEVRAADGGVGAGLYLGTALRRFPGWHTELSANWNELERDGAGGSDQIYQLGVDLLRRFAWTPELTPYAVGGLAASYEEIRGDSSTQPSLGLGAGLLWRLPLPAWSLRLDARALAQENDYESAGMSDSGRALLVDGRFGLGLQWNSGVQTVATSDDADRDGVPDGQDLCPDSLPDAQVDATGCEALSLADADGDGVPDRMDSCPGTPRGTVVNASGCGTEAEVQLRGVNFEFDSDRLTPQAREVLLPIAELLRGGLKDIRIEIAGHTDARGDDDYNRALSARRAWSVKNFLVEHGVATGRLIATGYGASRPVADNATEEGRAENRRVVFRVVD